MSAPDSFPALLKWILQKAYLPEIENPEMIYSPDKLSKSGGVVVPHRLGIAPRFKDRVGLDDLVLERSFSLLPLARRADGGEVGDHLLRVLRLASSRFSSDQDRLVDARVGHSLIGALGDRKDVRETLRLGDFCIID